uniref:Truncated envelope glycoprotein n=1 Tax=Human immunodeficiency virus type 1 TaxID=11676 RepID=Q3S5D8_HV1|nr:truncated envelope glycoprotein [Human immunodeficiency virus 1]
MRVKEIQRNCPQWWI